MYRHYAWHNAQLYATPSHECYARRNALSVVYFVTLLDISQVTTLPVHTIDKKKKDLWL